MIKHNYSMSIITMIAIAICMCIITVNYMFRIPRTVYDNKNVKIKYSSLNDTITVTNNNDEKLILLIEDKNKENSYYSIQRTDKVKLGLASGKEEYTIYLRLDSESNDNIDVLKINCIKRRVY